MTIVVITLIVVALVIVLTDLRRMTAVRCIERSEKLRLRFSEIRHRLVMHAGSGEMTESERAAFIFLYKTTAFMLRHPKRYRLFSDVVCSLYLDGAPPPPVPLRRQDISPRIRPLLQAYVSACNDLVQEFAAPLLVFMAYLGDESVVDCVRNAGRRRRELEAERRRVEEWRDAGVQALG